MTETETETTTIPLDQITGDYTIDPAHTSLAFIARHAMVTKVRGRFGEFTGTLHLDGANPAASTAQLQIAVASVDTRSEQRDGHLRSADFFDVENHPHMSFTSTSAEQVDDETFRVTGDLTIRTITKPVTIEWTWNGAATDPFGNQRVGFEGKAVVNRKDWDLTWNAVLAAGGVLVSDKITLEFDVSAIRDEAAAA